MGNRHPPSWTGFPDPKNKGSELRDHVFEILADRLGWDGTEEEFMDGLERLRDENQRTKKQAPDIRDSR